MTQLEYNEFVLTQIKQDKYSEEFDKHAAIGLTTEAGEFLQCYRKQYWQDKNIEKKQKIDELADVMFYFTMCKIALGVTDEQLRQINVEKLTLKNNLENLANRATNGFTIQPIGALRNRENSIEYHSRMQAVPNLFWNEQYAKLHNDKPAVSKLTAYGRLCQQLSKLLGRV